jgi:S1-C subfamily serine protease
MRLIALFFVAMSLASCQTTRPDADVYREMTQSVFKVKAPMLMGGAVGTAFVMDTPDGRVAISADHVCAHSVDGTMTASKFNSMANEKLKILGLDEKLDLCAMEAPKDIPALKLAKGVLQRYESLYSAGYPLNTPLTPRSGSLIAAAVNTFDHSQNPSILEETSIAAWPGDSGSPVVDNNGGLVGVLTQAEMQILTSNMVTRKSILEFLSALHDHQSSGT